MRVIFFAGKGGVGKTTVAAATGIRAAEMGLRTLIMSLDTAHSLFDVFDLNRGLLDHNRGRPVKVAQRLWAQELDIQEEIQRNWGEIHRYLSLLLNTSGLDEILADELAILPGMEEVSLLLYLNRYVQKRSYDLIVLDCAPTGESLRFISIPTTLEWYMKKIFRIERTVARYARPLARRFTDVPLPGEDYFEAIERLFERLRGIEQILADQTITSVRLVTNPEKIVLKETQRAFLYFCLYRMSVDAIIMNRMLPAEVEDAYFALWKSRQQEHVSRAREIFSPVPVLPLALDRGEVLGPEGLARLARGLYGDRSPMEHFFEGQPHRWEKQDGQVRLRMRVPFLKRQEVDLTRSAEELVVRLGGFKQHILLPRQAAAAETVRAVLEGDELCIVFEGGVS